MAWPFDSEEQLDEWVDRFITNNSEAPPADIVDLEAHFNEKHAAANENADVQTLLSDPEIFGIHNGHEEAVWRFILKVVARRPSAWAIEVLAAGLLEDIIAIRGHAFIDRIELEARRDPFFREALHGVWRNSSASDVWERLERARGTARPPNS